MSPVRLIYITHFAIFGSSPISRTCAFLSALIRFIISDFFCLLVLTSTLAFFPSSEARSMYSSLQPFAVLNSPRITLMPRTWEKPSCLDAPVIVLKYLTSPSLLVALTN